MANQRYKESLWINWGKIMYKKEIIKLNKRIEQLYQSKHPNYSLIIDLTNQIAILEIEA